VLYRSVNHLKDSENDFIGLKNCPEGSTRRRHAEWGFFVALLEHRLPRTKTKYARPTQLTQQSTTINSLPSIMADSSNENESLLPMIPPGLVNKRIAELDVAKGLHSPVQGNDQENDEMPRASRLRLTSTPPADVWIRSDQRIWQPSGTAAPIAPATRPKLRRKAATAPPGAFHSTTDINPQPPRRVISARTADANRNSGSRRRRTPAAMPQMARLPQLGTSATGSIISRRKTNTKSRGKVGLKPKASVRRLSPYLAPKSQMISEVLDARHSFSEKPRVREKLRSKKLEMLKVSFVDFQSKNLPSTPLSLTTTPRELYGVSQSTEEARPTYNTDKGKMASFVTVAPDVLYPRPIKSTVSPSAVYRPGPIRLEERPELEEGSFTKGREPRGNRFSDTIALDTMVMYFEGLGVVAECSEACLDRYWLADRRAGGQGAHAQKTAPSAARWPWVPSSRGSQPAKMLHGDSPAAAPGRRTGRLRQLWKSSQEGSSLRR